MAWTSLTYPFGSLLTSTKMTQLFDNLTALANGDSGAPAIIQAAIAVSAVGQGELKTASGTVSTSAALALLILPGGEYGFYPQTRRASAGGTQFAQIAQSMTNNSFAAYITLGTSSTPDAFAQQRYIQSSPPYMIGGKIWGHFLYLLRRISDGVVISSYEAEDPCWAYNGPPHIAKDHPDRISAVPHPFVEYWDKDPAVDGLEIVLVDLSTTNTKEWIDDNRAVGKGLLEDVGSILVDKGKDKTFSDYEIPNIPNFTNRVKIVVP